MDAAKVSDGQHRAWRTRAQGRGAPGSAVGARQGAARAGALGRSWSRPEAGERGQGVRVAQLRAGKVGQRPTSTETMGKGGGSALLTEGRSVVSSYEAGVDEVMRIDGEAAAAEA